MGTGWERTGSPPLRPPGSRARVRRGGQEAMVTDGVFERVRFFIVVTLAEVANWLHEMWERIR